jgi:hypothetical protein
MALVRRKTFIRMKTLQDYLKKLEEESDDAIMAAQLND